MTNHNLQKKTAVISRRRNSTKIKKQSSAEGETPRGEVRSHQQEKNLHKGKKKSQRRKQSFKRIMKILIIKISI